MFDQKKAAEYLVVAWCKSWSLSEYLKVVLERPKLCDFDDAEGFKATLAEACEAFPWLTHEFRAYPRTVRQFIGSAYPKLSAWLFSRPDDLSRLKCAEQIMKLRCPKSLGSLVKDEDRKEMKSSTRDFKQNAFSYQSSRAAFKTHQRSAWNVCKA